MTPSEPNAGTQRTSSWTWIAILGGLAVMLLLLWAMSGLDAADNADEVDAQVMCEQFVKKQLKAPSTADFSEQSAISTGDNAWKVTGAVDAENIFGAKIRGSYSCELEYLGDDQWHATSVDIQ